MAFTVAYAYPHSAYAAECGASKTGCWIVERTINIKTGANLKRPTLAIKSPFKTQANADRWLKGWTKP